MKKLLSLITCFALCVMLVMPVSAAEVKATENVAVEEAVIENEAVAYSTGYFTGQTGKMNSWEGTESAAYTISSGSIPREAVVTKVTLNVPVSSGSSGFYIFVECPDGTYAERYVSRSGQITITDLNGHLAYGKWKISIMSVGQVSTATARMRVDYSY